MVDFVMPKKVGRPPAVKMPALEPTPAPEVAMVEREVVTHQVTPDAPAPAPAPAPMSKLEEEMAAGRRALAEHAAHMARVRPPEAGNPNVVITLDPKVPGMDQKGPAVTKIG